MPGLPLTGETAGGSLLKKYIIEHIAKTKMIVKEDQILVDVEMIFKEIEAAGGDWKKVWEEFKAYLKDVKGEK